MVARIQIRRDTAGDWTSANPVLSAGELGYESDTDKAKIGDGSTNWNSLPYFIYRPTFAEVLSKPTTIAGFGITDAFSGSFSDLTNKPTDIAGYGITDAFSGAFSALTGKPTTISGYGITDAFSGSFAALTNKPTTIAGYGITDAFSGSFAALTSKPTTIAGYGITDAFSGSFGDLTGKPTTIAGYGITDALTTLSFAQLTGKPSTIAGYGITDAFSGDFSSLSGRPTTLSGYGITDAASLASPAFTGTPTAPTAALTTNNTQLATTAFVKGKIEQSILTGAKIYVQDTEPSFNAFDEIWIETDTGSIYKSVAGTSTIPLDSSLVSSSSSNITIPAAGASDTRLSLSAGSPSGTVNLSPSVFLESFSSQAGEQSHNIGVVTYDDNTTATVNASSFTRSSGNAFDTKIKSFTYSTTGTTTETTHITLTISGKPEFAVQESNIQAKVDAIIDSAPGALNTLNELAAALGDDANFSTTVTNSLATKAPLASPALTGTPTAPTAAANTNTTQIATTAFVQQEIGTPFVKTDLSVTQNTASGTGTLAYNNSSGVFSYTPPDLSSFLTSVSFASLTGKPTTLAGYGITDSLTLGTTATTALAGNTTFSFASLTGKPTTIAGYGITDALTLGTTSTTALAGNTTFSFASLTGKPTTIAGYGITDAFDGAYSSLTGKPTLFSGVFSDLTSKPTTIAGYGITDAFDGAFSSLSGKPTTISGYGITDPIALTNANIDIGSNNFITTGKVLFANMYSALSDLPSATTYHGMFAHVHATGAAYFAHAGNWIELANKSYVTFSNLGGKPTTLAGYGITDAAPLASPAFTGLPTAATASSGTNTTQIATTAFVQQELTAAGSYNNASVDTHLNTSTAASGEVLSWNGSDYDWVAQSGGGGGGGGGASVTTSDSAPSSPSDGDLWYNTNLGGLFVYYQDANSAQWVEVVGRTGATGATGAAGTNISIGDAAPSSPTVGQLWWNSSTNKLYIRYQDADSTQWVQATTPGATGATGPAGPAGSAANITVSDSAPSSPSAGQLWWNSSTNKLYIYYTDANSSQWIQASTPGATGATGAAGATVGRNKIINGNFDFWQRGTSFTTSGYTCDRWRSAYDGGTTTVCSRQSFTLGQTDVPNNPEYYIRLVTTTDSSADARANLTQKIEDVRTFQGQTVTISFWAKADAVKNIAIEPLQNFGTSGSPSSIVYITPQKFALSTTWTKYTKTFTIPSIAGKTLGTDNNDYLQFSFWLDAGSDYNSRTSSLGNQSGTFEFAQVQLEEGSSATDFEDKSIGETIRECSRYFVGTLHIAGGGYATASGQTARAYTNATFPVRMRANPTVTTTVTQSSNSISSVGYVVVNPTSGVFQGTSSSSGVPGSVWWRATAELDAEL